MPLKYACFISYRHGQYALAKRIVTDVHDALANELEVLVKTPAEPVAIDRERLKPGMFYNEALASAICESACMVVVFTPTYFSTDDTYCAREYKAMELLEEQRLKLLGKSVDQQNGLIIPLIFRGTDRLPKALKGRRQYQEFKDFSLADAKIGENPQYKHTIKEISVYIATRFEELTLLPDDSCQCDDFTLPTEEEVRSWLSQIVLPATPFPLRPRNHP